MPCSSKILHAIYREAEDSTAIRRLSTIPLLESPCPVLHGSNSIFWNHRGSVRNRGASLSRGMHRRPFRHIANGGIQILFVFPQNDHRHRIGAPRSQAPSSLFLRLEACKGRPFRVTPAGRAFRDTGSRTRCFFTAFPGRPQSHRCRGRSTWKPVWQTQPRLHLRRRVGQRDERFTQCKCSVVLISYSAYLFLYVEDSKPERYH